MKPFKKPYHQTLFDSFLLGCTVAQAAKAADVSQPTARKFRDDYAEDLRKAQAETTDGVLDSLKKLLPKVVERLAWWQERPDLKAVQEGTYTPPPPLPDGVHARTLGDDLRLAASIREMYDVMRDVEMEKRMQALERRLAELTKPPEEGSK